MKEFVEARIRPTALPVTRGEFPEPVSLPPGNRLSIFARIIGVCPCGIGQGRVYHCDVIVLLVVCSHSWA